MSLPNNGSTARGAPIDITAEFLLGLLSRANIPQTREEWLDVSFDLEGGWRVTVFYDCGELDYIESFTSPDGTTVDIWSWPDSELEKIVNWRG